MSAAKWRPANRDARYARALAFLRSHAAGDIPHPGGTLLEHLEGTRALLDGWGNRPSVCLAGLCHAAYGTDGFAQALIGVDERPALREIIGPASERLVYLYCSCDRGRVYAQVGVERQIAFRDRFTGVAHTPPAELITGFFEITFANELEIARKTPTSLERMRPFLAELFPRCEPFVSREAYDCFAKTLGEG